MLLARGVCALVVLVLVTRGLPPTIAAGETTQRTFFRVPGPEYTDPKLAKFKVDGTLVVVGVPTALKFTNGVVTDKAFAFEPTAKAETTANEAAKNRKFIRK